MKKLIILIVSVFIHLVIVSFCILFVYVNDWMHVSYIGSDDEPRVAYNYYKRVNYSKPESYVWGCFTEYYYHDEDDEFYINNSNYTLIEDNTEIIKEHIGNYIAEINKLEDTFNIDFDYDVITSNDYFYKSSPDGSIYYYDIDDHVLYEIDSLTKNDFEVK